MEISFANRRLKKECESQALLQRAHGQACARKIQARLADLTAAAVLETMRELPGSCHELTGDRKGQLSIRLADGKRLVFEPANNPVPLRSDGGLDWSRIDAVRVLQIVDYHRG
jgi:proteic killer suppression protein